MANKKESVVQSMLWKLFERGGVQIVRFIVSIVIARLLSPSEYGVISVITIFISFATCFVQSGLSTALVRKTEIDNEDLSSVFFYGLFVAIILYVILFFCAPLIESYFQIGRLAICIRLTAVVLFPGAYNSVQNAIVARNMQFRKQFIGGLTAAIISGVIGIVLAVLNFGVYALVAQQVTYQVCACICLQFLVKWFPKFKFSFNKTKQLLKFGMKILGGTLIDTLFHNIESLVIGKKYNSENLALYDKGKQFPLIIIDNLDGTIQTVMLPVFSAKQSNVELLKKAVRDTINLSTFISFAAMSGLAAVGSSLIYVVLGEKWLGAVPFLQIYCITAALFPFQTANLQAFSALGESGAYFWIMTIKRTLSLLILCVAIFCFSSIYAIVIATVLFEIVGVLVTCIFNKKLLNYKIRELLKDTLPNLLISAFMFCVVYAMSYIKISQYLLLVLQVFVGCLCVFVVAKLSKNTAYGRVAEYIKKLRNKNIDSESKQEGKANET